MGKLENKVALITGGARGMGAAFVERCIEDGATVYFTDILDEPARKLEETLGSKAHYIHQDVTSEADWKKVVDVIGKAEGRLDVLVNNAGIVFFKMLGEMTMAEYMKVINVNQLSVFLGITHCLPLLKKSQNSSIINISSINGIKGGAGASAYSSSKYAVRGLTQSAALEFAPLNIRVNSIHPGAVATPMLVQEDTKDAVKEFAKTIPLGRIGETHELASIVAFLASDESTYCTGSEFVVDGGALAK